MAFAEEIFAGESRLLQGPGYSLEEVTGPVAEWVTVAIAKDHMNIPATITAHDANITRFIPACRRNIEAHINECVFEQVFNQRMDLVPRKISLLTRPVLGIVEVGYIPTMDNDTELLFASTQYAFTRNGFIFARSSWPSHRGFQSFRVKFKAGRIALPVGSDANAILAAQALVPADLKVALLEYVGSLFQSREGQLEVGNDAEVKLGIIPPAIQQKLGTWTDWRMF